MRPLLFKLHLYISIAISLYVALLGVTGAILAFDTEIEYLTHAKLAYVTPAPPRLSFTEIGEAVAKAYPGQKITSYFMSGAPNLSAQVGVGALLVLVNPYTGQILGNLDQEGDVVGNTLANIGRIHRRLTPHAREGGLTQSFVSWVTVAALFLVLSGIWLWWPRMRFGIGKSGGRPFWYDLHATLGIAAAAFLILLTVTGIIIGFGRTTVPVLYAITGSQPAPEPKIPPPPADGTQPIPIDRAFAIAGDALPGATPISIFLRPSMGYIAWVRTPRDRDLNGRSRVIVDQYTGAVLYIENAEAASAGTRLVDMIQKIHLGKIFGMPSKVFMALASLTIALQAVSGVVMWIKRVPLRSMIPALVGTAAVAAIAVYTVFAPVG